MGELPLVPKLCLGTQLCGKICFPDLEADIEQMTSF